VDPSVDVLHGPNPLQRSGTVTVPKELLREIGVEAGDRVHWMLNPDMPGTLVLVPAAMVRRIMPDLTAALKQAGR
jgi:bifunctional DNA-binding transcriptional regulator/antitoxin component of YhaV-PrlF toxin-antitoxin module